MNKQEIHEEEFEETNTDNETITEKAWRREKVWELKAKGYTHREILEELKQKDPLLKISMGAITNDLRAKQKEVKGSFQTYIENELPQQHSLAVTGLDEIIKESWRIFNSEKDAKAKLQALSVIQSAIMSKQVVLGDPAQIEKAIKLVSKLRTQNNSNPGDKQNERSATGSAEKEATA